jgi:hypothetical protein
MENKFKNIIGNFATKEGEVIATSEDDKVYKFQTFNAFEQFGDLMKASNYQKTLEQIQEQFNFMIEVQYAYLAKFGDFKKFNYKEMIKVISENFDKDSSLTKKEAIDFVLSKI